MAAKLTVDDDLIRRLAELLDETGLNEIEVGEGEHHVRVARGGGSQPVYAAPALAQTVPSGPDAAAAPAGSSGEVDAAHPGAVTSPMVGTLYVAPEPGAPPFVVPGGSVRQGDTLFLIEAMKTMNPVRAHRDGKVVRIVVPNECPVEYGEVLALIE